MPESRTVCIAVIVTVVVCVVFIGIMVGVSLKKLNSDEVALQYDTVAKSLAREPKNEGLHAGPPGYEFIKFPNVYKTIDFKNLRCLNSQGIPIFLDVSYQYKARGKQLYDIVMDFRNFDNYKVVLQYAGKSAIHESCSMFNTSQFQAERGAFQESLRTMLKIRYDLLHCDVSDLQVNNIARPTEYETAVKNKEAAKQNIDVALQERPRKLTEAQTKKKEAAAQANITIEKAESNARIILQKAETEADAILDEYAKEAETYKQIVDAGGLALDSDGFISYMGVRTISAAKNPVHVAMKAPAKSSYLNP
ncbi:uncharacterized protein LOC135499497 isoform X2 [Lineus longissimus]|uniref:uncharacterized protein LOC135499497 isoform X2 n=1 Tax=Lineus longissimus TaxID=88925 RepID=UPI002B4F1480